MLLFMTSIHPQHNPSTASKCQECYDAGFCMHSSMYLHERGIFGGSAIPDLIAEALE